MFVNHVGANEEEMEHYRTSQQNSVSSHRTLNNSPLPDSASGTGVRVSVTSAHHADHGTAAFPPHASCVAATCLDNACAGTCSSNCATNEFVTQTTRRACGSARNSGGVLVKSLPMWGSCV